MFACQAWAHIDADLNHKLLDSACLNDKKLYRTVISDMASQLRKRPQRLLDMPRVERHALFQPLLSLPQLDIVAQNLIIQWLASERVQMLNDFLDALSIPHDGEGCAEEFPETMEKEKIATAVAKLKGSYPEMEVNLYLNVFDRISGVNWELEQSSN